MRYTNQTDMHIIRRASADPSRRVRRHLGMGGFGAGAAVGQAVTGLKAGTTAASVSSAIGVSVGSAIGAGAAAGSVVPIIGTAIGAIVGLIASGVLNRKKDPEDYNFQQAMAISRSNGPQAVLDIGNKYLVLAGLFDLHPDQIKGNIPIYKKYGRMGEYRFVTDMCNVIQSAANAGQITANDTPQTVFNRIVQPWINSFGFGAMSDSNASMITYILLGMTAEYLAGLQTQWYDVGGRYPFGSLPPFSLPAAAQPSQPQVTASPTPSPIPTTASAQQVQTNTELARWQGGQIPSLGDPIHYAWNGSAFLALPQEALYMGADPTTHAWIVQIAGQKYALSGSTLQPYALTPQQTTQQVSASDTSTGASIPAQYIPASGGGGGYYPAPSNVTPTSVTLPSTGLSTTEIALGIAAVLAAMYFMQHAGQRR